MAAEPSLDSARIVHDREPDGGVGRNSAGGGDVGEQTVALLEARGTVVGGSPAERGSG